MPSKYSHSVVLASQGIVNLPSGQQVDHSKPCRSSPPARTPQTLPRGRSAPVIYHRAGATAFRHPSTLFGEPGPEKLKQPPRSHLGHSNGIDIVSTPVGSEPVATEPPVQDVATKDLQPRQPLPPRVHSFPNSRPLPPFDFDFDHPDIAQHTSSPDSSIKAQESAPIQTHVRRPGPSSVRKDHPRSDVNESRRDWELHSPYAPTRRTARAEPRLSLQQFLDSLPRVDDPEEATQGSPELPSRSEKRALSLSPHFHPKGLRPVAQTKLSSQSLGREGTSFVESSDEEDGLPVVAKPTSALHRTNQTEKQGSLDLTGEVHLPQTNPKKSHQEGTPERQAHPGAGQRRSKRYSTDVDDSDSFDPLPLQKHSPLPKLKSLIVRESDYQGRVLFDIPDDQLSPIPRASIESPGSTTRKLMVSEAEPGRPGFADVGESPRNHSRSPNTIETHRLYTRMIHDSIPTNEQRGPMSRSPDLEVRGRTSPSPRPAPVPAARPANLMGNFGVPSIVRPPEEQAMGSPRARSPTQSSPKPAVEEASEKQRRKLFVLSLGTKRDKAPPSEWSSERRSGVSKGNTEEWALPTVEPSDFGEVTTTAFGRISIKPDGPRGQRHYQEVNANVQQLPVPDDVSDTDTDEWDDELDDDEYEYEDVEEDGDDAALPPPDISRHRRWHGDEDGTETAYPAVESGHDEISEHDGRVNDRDGNDRPDATLTETRVVQTQRRKTKAQSVLGRLMRR